MIQLSYSFDGSGPEAAMPLMVEAVSGGERTRVTGAWQGRDLRQARLEMAAYLEQLAPELEVRSNLTGQEKTVEEWVRDLKEAPSVEGIFESRHSIEDGKIFARLFGCTTFGESDIILIADEAVGLDAVSRFLAGWASYRFSDPKTPEWTSPFPWGYWLVSFGDSEVGDDAFWEMLREKLDTHHLKEAFDKRMWAPAPRIVIEAAGMEELSQGDPYYVVGATSALEMERRHREVARRVGAELLSAPCAHDAAGFCDRVYEALEAGEKPDFFAYREAAQHDYDAGWRVGCLDEDHVHDAESLRIAPLSTLAMVPGAIDYVALPQGWVFSREEGYFWIQRPGQAESYRDDTF